MHAFFLNSRLDVGVAVDARDDDMVQAPPQKHTAMLTQATLGSDDEVDE